MRCLPSLLGTLLLLPKLLPSSSIFACVLCFLRNAKVSLGFLLRVLWRSTTRYGLRLWSLVVGFAVARRLHLVAMGSALSPLSRGRLLWLPACGLASIRSSATWPPRGHGFLGHAFSPWPLAQACYRLHFAYVASTPLASVASSPLFRLGGVRHRRLHLVAISSVSWPLAPLVAVGFASSPPPHDLCLVAVDFASSPLPRGCRLRLSTLWYSAPPLPLKSIMLGAINFNPPQVMEFEFIFKLFRPMVIHLVHIRLGAVNFNPPLGRLRLMAISSTRGCWLRLQSRPG
ncbi:hypothetical protein NL676_011750 [Syzygium grande]|nr:hypothetical protein NL676_011750 [Syzygium grande]